jgi:hypothetical protein
MVSTEKTNNMNWTKTQTHYEANHKGLTYKVIPHGTLAILKVEGSFTQTELVYPKMNEKPSKAAMTRAEKMATI